MDNEDYCLICPECGTQSTCDPAFLTDESPMPYCNNCGAALIQNETPKFPEFSPPKPDHIQ